MGESDYYRGLARIRQVTWAASKTFRRVVPISAVRTADLVAGAAAWLFGWWLAGAAAEGLDVLTGVLAALLVAGGVGAYIKDRALATKSRPSDGVDVALDLRVVMSLRFSEWLFVQQTILAIALAAISHDTWMALASMSIVALACIAVHDPCPPPRTVWSAAADAARRLVAAVTPSAPPVPIPVSY